MTPPAERVEPRDRVLARGGMSRRMRAASFAVAETLFTTVDGPPPRERLEWLCDDLADFLAQSGRRATFIYWLCLTVISVIAPWFARRALPFRLLPPQTRTEALTRMERSPVALALFGAKAILCFIYYEHPESAALIGHDGECLVPEAELRRGATP